MGDEVHGLQTYVSDMLALERHVRMPFETQSKDDDFQNYTGAGDIVTRLLQLSDRHIAALGDSLSALGGHEASPVKSAVADFEGAVAGAIDKMRKTKVSKALRDDYTALALCTAGYTMLQTTALAMNDQSVADLATSHLTDYAQCIMSIGNALPAVVLQELRDTGLSVDESAAEPARQAVERAWRSGSRGVSTSETGTIGDVSSKTLG